MIGMLWGNTKHEPDESITDWIFMVQGEYENSNVISDIEVDEQGLEQLLLDGGAFTNVCPLKYAEEWLLQKLEDHERVTLRSATGKVLRVYGKRDIKFTLWGDQGEELVTWVQLIVSEIFE